MKTTAFFLSMLLTVLLSGVLSGQQKPTGYAPVGLLRFLKIPRADIVGYSLGGGVAMQCAIRHPEKVRKVVNISAPYARDGWIKEANDMWPNLTWELVKGTPAEIGYKKLSPTPDGFPNFFNHIKAMALRPYDFGADKRAG